jgi:type IV secretory pathway TrbL component
VHRFHPRKPRITPALVISMLALFVALTAPGFAQNIVPLAKRALTADKAKTANTAKVATLAKTANTAKTADTATTAQTANVAVDAQTLGGQTAAQIAGAAGPASSIAGTTFTVRSKGWSTQNQGDRTTERVLCNTGEKALGGGWDMPNGHANPTSDAPLADLSGWVFSTWALSGNNVPANGSVWVVCAKVS